MSILRVDEIEGRANPNVVKMPISFGTTSERPIGAAAVVGYYYFDTTLGLPIWYNGNYWINAAGIRV